MWIGIDFGTRFIGLSIGQMWTRTAKPLASIAYQTLDELWPVLDRSITTWQPEGLVVGIPKHHGKIQTIGRQALQFKDQLQCRYPHLIIEEADERDTTQAARDLIKSQSHQKKRKSNTNRVDDVAAQIMLESWLRERKL